jgi:hypothetical protein
MAERTESEGFYEMLWDCEHCGTKALLGKSQRHCATCGAPQNPDKRYFPKEGEAKPIDGHRFEGSDRHCPACNTPMGTSATNCTSCGSPLDGSKEVRGIASVPVVAAKAPKRKNWPIIVGVIVLVVVAIWWFFLRTKSATLSISAHRWERSVALEKYGDWQQEAWRNQVPSGASMPVCQQKERSKKQVEDGEECNTERVDKKDGTFEQVRKCKPKYRSEPVYDDWCSFTVRNWKRVDASTTSGTGLDATWPANVPAADLPAQLGAIRSGARTETLILDFGKGGTCDVSDAVWRKYNDGQSVKVEVRARSGQVVCSSL